MMNTITPCTIIEVTGKIEGEIHTSTLSIAALIYDQFSIGDREMDLTSLLVQLSRMGIAETQDLRGYGPCTITVKE